MKILRVFGIFSTLLLSLFWPCTEALDFSALPNCSNVAEAAVVGQVESLLVNEASGLVASRQYSDVLWIHNDSGDRARIFAIKTTGELIGEVNLEGVDAVDFEDITISSDPDGSNSYIYVGDIGNNRRLRRSQKIYRFPEPNPADFRRGHMWVWSESIVTLTLLSPHFPSTEDIECLAFDPNSSDLYLISKGEHANVLKVRSEHFEGVQGGKNVVLVMENVGRLNLERVVACDISASGSTLALRLSDNRGAFLYTNRPENATIEAWITDKDDQKEENDKNDEKEDDDNNVCSLNLAKEKQGEAVAFSKEGQGFFTTSEGLHQPIYYYEIKTTAETGGCKDTKSALAIVLSTLILYFVCQCL